VSPGPAEEERKKNGDIVGFFCEVRRNWLVQDGKLRESVLVLQDGLPNNSLSAIWAQLAEELIPLETPADSKVEMTWAVFGDPAQELYLALLKTQCVQERLGTSRHPDPTGDLV
jgi:hypothetical protein